MNEKIQDKELSKKNPNLIINDEGRILNIEAKKEHYKERLLRQLEENE